MLIYYLDINEDCRKRDLEKIFSKYGPLREIWLASYAPFYAFINYESRGDMEVKIELWFGLIIMRIFNSFFL